MNRDRFEGVWKQFSGKAKERWCRLNGDVPGMVVARRVQRAGWIQEGRGISKETVERQLRKFLLRNRYWDLIKR